ncbi:electron transport complex protein RsxE [Proteus mirabilis]|uniref:Electron transport complex protein RsxE n=1 Tax=Proteus mirabilis TaxID=584 RepID=A0A379GI43_PROMI|nr:electron transport complex protein RsxE [Proteus mirabilis]
MKFFPSAIDGFAMGLGATAALFVLGAMREILGNGTLFDGADLLLGEWAQVLRVEIVHLDSPFLLAILPPGAFIGLGFMLAIKYLIDEKQKKRVPSTTKTYEKEQGCGSHIVKN